MALQDCISEEAREGEGQSRYPCSALRAVTADARAMVLLDSVSGEAMEGEGQPRSPWVVHLPVTMPGEGPRASKDRCARSPPHARWNASLMIVSLLCRLIIVNSVPGLQSNACHVDVSFEMDKVFFLSRKG